MASQWFVTTGRQAHAFLGNDEASHTFRFNPDEVTWDYAETIVPYDTIGGRVLQVLSGKTNALTINGRSGSRGELQRLVRNCSEIMKYHIRTQSPVAFLVPSKQWNFLVYLQAVPQVGWSVGSTSYPYQIVLNVQDDLQGIKTQEMRSNTLERLAEGIGYNPNVHGGDAPGFAELVNSLQLTFPTLQGGSGQGDDGIVVDVPTSFSYPNETRAAGRIDFSRRTGTTPSWVRQNPALFLWNGITLQEEAMRSFQAISKKLGMKIGATSSFRTYEKQNELYLKYINDDGNPAARPGTGFHEIGIAVDVQEYFYEQSMVTNALLNNGWFRGVEGEPWHFSYRVSG